MLTRYEQHGLTWIDLATPTSAEVKALMKEFDIDPLIAEELLTQSFKPKVERRGEAVYVILHFPTLQHHTPSMGQEVDFVFGKRFLITTRYDTIDPLHTFAKAFEVQTVLGRGGTSNGGHLFASAVRAMYTAIQNESDALQLRLNTIEERIFAGDERGMVVELSQVGRNLHDFRQALLPHSEMIASLEPIATRFFGQEFSYYVRELSGACERSIRVFDNLRDSLFELRATNDSLLSTRQNEIIQRLTVLAFIFLPLTFIGQVFGINSDYVPLLDHPQGFWIVVGAMTFIAAGSFVYFKRKGWL